jgi:hypothetical protein
LRVITLSKLGNRDDEQFLAGMAAAQKTMRYANNEFNLPKLFIVRALSEIVLALARLERVAARMSHNGKRSHVRRVNGSLRFSVA